MRLAGQTCDLGAAGPSSRCPRPTTTCASNRPRQRHGRARRVPRGPVQTHAASSPATENPAPAEAPGMGSDPAPATPAAPARPRFGLRSWLTSRSGGSAEEQTAQDRAVMLAADGMAAGPPEAAPVPSPAWRRARPAAPAADPRAAAREARIAPRLDHAALRLLRQRVSERSQPGARADAFKLGLVVEGGGMRGAVSGGALQAMHDLGLRAAFDAVYGSSAGAINATFFLSGQREGVEIYHDHIANPEFINLKRLWKPEGKAPVLDLSYLIDHVMHSVQPLDWESVVTSPVPLKVVASSLDTLAPVILDGFSCRADLAACLKASANVPEIAGGPLLHRGQRLVDAAVFEPVPFRSAIADGCTHVLVLCTRPRRPRASGVRRLNAALADAVESAVKRAVLSPDYMVPAWKAEVAYLMQDGLSQDEMLLLATDEGAAGLPWFAGAHVFPVYPGEAASFSPLCIEVPTLKAGVAEGRRAVLEVARSALHGLVDFSPFEEELSGAAAAAASNIITLAPGEKPPRRRLLTRTPKDFSHHA